jgi:hypothetical protein
LLYAAALALLVCLAAFAQSTATLEGMVTDPSGLAIGGAVVRLSNPVAGFDRKVVAGADGRFTLANLPLHGYVLRIEAPGFGVWERTVALASNVPMHVAASLTLAGAQERITVSGGPANLVNPEETGTHAQMNQNEIDKLPLRSSSRGLESVLVRFPGFAQNANGAIHPRGTHNQMTFVVDGMPISDQLTGAFANAVDPNIVQTVEVYTGNVSAEYGNKTAAVANITTKSGLGSQRRLTGSVALNAARFDTLGALAQAAGESGRFGYSASANLQKSNRYLDQVSFDNLHNGGNSERAFLRLDAQASAVDTLRLNLMSGRSSFQLANLRSQHAAGQDQRQALRDFSASLGWVRVLGPTATYDATASYRTSVAQLFPSRFDTPVTAAQARHLTTITLANRINKVAGAHTLRAGADVQRFPVSENFSFAVTDPAFNPPGEPGFIPTLLAHDLSRGGRLFHFSDRASGGFYSAFVQDQIRSGRFTAALGLRFDSYRFLVRDSQFQPRLGVSFNLRETGTILRASYNRMFQTPPNENLLVSNSERAGVLVAPDVRATLGGSLVRVRPERQNLYEIGLQQAAGSKVSINASFYHKDARDQQDNDNFFNTGVIFPISLARLNVNGVEARMMTLPVGGVSGSFAVTHSRAFSTPPFTGGLFIGNSAVAALASGPFVIDHDQALALNASAQYTHRSGFWLSGSARYDSGLVSNPSDPAAVARDPDYRDLLPYVNLASDPPRVRPRTIVDLVAGYELRRDGQRRWEAVIQLSNLTAATALYNFQSIFVGTRLAEPRSVGARLRWYW